MSDYRDPTPLYSYPSVIEPAPRRDPRDCPHVSQRFVLGQGWVCQDCGRLLEDLYPPTSQPRERNQQ